jgi:eukaryotic-like serine/threonine-protein kinase
MIGRTLEHYRIESKLGEGGMGVVYKGHDPRLDRWVAIKVLPPEKLGDPAGQQRFLREARAASALNHPGIVTIHDIRSHDGVEFIVMEFIEGKTLAELIPPGGLPEPHLLRARRGAPGGHPASRSQAVEHHGDAPGPDQGARLRSRETDRKA